MKKVALAVLFGLFIGLVVPALFQLVPSWKLNEVGGWLVVPGMILAQLVSPGGVHGDNPRLWLLTMHISNVLTYTLLSAVPLVLRERKQSR